MANKRKTLAVKQEVDMRDNFTEDSYTLSHNRTSTALERFENIDLKRKSQDNSHQRMNYYSLLTSSDSDVKNKKVKDTDSDDSIDREAFPESKPTKKRKSEDMMYKKKSKDDSNANDLSDYDI